MMIDREATSTPNSQRVPTCANMRQHETVLTKNGKNVRSSGYGGRTGTQEGTTEPERQHGSVERPAELELRTFFRAGSRTKQ